MLQNFGGEKSDDMKDIAESVFPDMVNKQCIYFSVSQSRIEQF